jgi:uncharacterized damage-inducible protein DinB
MSMNTNGGFDMNAAERAQSLGDVLKFNDEVLMVALTDVTDDIARRRLRDGGPSMAWNIGHMLHHRNQIAAPIGCRGPAFDLARYADSATDGRDYPAIGQLQKTWNEFSARLVSALRGLSADQLAAPSPMRLPHGEQTLLDALRFVVWHETLHLGQVSMLRSHHGLTPLATLVVERAAVA